MMNQLISSATAGVARWMRQRSWRWRAVCWLVLLCAELAAIPVQLDSKVNASGPIPGGGTGSGHYDAGWPLIYTRIERNGITFAQWQAALHRVPSPAAIAWPIFFIDVVWLGIVFALGLGLVVGLWSLVPRVWPVAQPAALAQASLIGVVLATAWAIISVGVVTGINQSQPTDAATWVQITQPLTLVALLPGVVGYGAQRGFEGNGGLGIALTNGPANLVELGSVLTLTVVLPAAIFAMLSLVIRRIMGYRQQRATEGVAQETHQ